MCKLEKSCYILNVFFNCPLNKMFNSTQKKNFPTLSVRDEGTTNQKIEMAWIGEDNVGKFEVILYLILIYEIIHF